MNIKNEGYIKFNIDWENRAIDFPDNVFNKLTYWRNIFYDKGLIGLTNEGIGYGNISVRFNKGFIISGSATGKNRNLIKEDFSIVTFYDIMLNKIKCKGKIKASSESLSHAALYEAKKEINAIIHIHCTELWEKYYNIWPTTDIHALYGTPEMALSLINLLQERLNGKEGIFIMGGHREGLIIFGEDIDSAGNLFFSMTNESISL